MSGFPHGVAGMLMARSGGICEMWHPPVCLGTAQQFHHRRLRSQGGKDTIECCVHICRACHDFAHDHPRLARENGWIVSAWKEPGGVLMLRRGEWTALLTDGRVEVW